MRKRSSTPDKRSVTHRLKHTLNIDQEVRSPLPKLRRRSLLLLGDSPRNDEADRSLLSRSARVLHILRERVKR
ncbi:hypothetical protein HC928_17215 [bacterium]|nr:hypothetical protein [Leptolyngbyaceae cyanobacterium SM1_4_3]NJL56698.1 hypothetical protein [bacterium]